MLAFPSSIVALESREAAMTALGAALADATTRGRGRIAVISGEPGIGKSAMASAIAQNAEAAGAVVTWGRAWEFADAPPYFPLWPCFRALGMSLDGGTNAHDPAHAYELWENVVSRIANATSGASVATTTTTTTTTTPHVWILEDLHAADLGTLDLLTFLTQPIRALRLFIVATIRSPDARLTDRVMQRLTRIARDGIDVRLDRLPNADVARLTEAMLGGQSLPDKALHQLVDLTGGNPLFVLECARAFHSAGGVEGTLGSLPTTVRQIVIERIEALPVATREALACGAVLGREFAASTVATMRGGPSQSLPARIIDVLLPALRLGVITEPPTKPGRFGFSHAIVRDAIEDSLSPDARASLHAKAEMALAALGHDNDDNDVVLERARHALLSLRLSKDETQQEQAAAAQTQTRALGILKRASGLLEREGAFDRAFDLEVRVEQARAAGFLRSASMEDRLRSASIARAAGRSDVSRGICDEVFARARAVKDAAAFARAVLLYAADVHPGRIDPKQVTLLEEARALLVDRDRDRDGGGGGDHELIHCRVLARLATAMMPARDTSIPIQLTRDAIARARATNDDAALIDVLDLAAWGLYTTPLDERVAVATELIERSLGIGNVLKAMAGYTMRAFCRVAASNFDGFEHDVESLLSLVQSKGVGHPRDRWRALLLASMRADALGHFVESERYLTEVKELAAITDDPALPMSLGIHEVMRARLQRRDDELRSCLLIPGGRVEDAMRGTAEESVDSALIRACCAARMEDVEATRSALAVIGSRYAVLLDYPAPASFFGEACALAGSDDLRRTIRQVLRERWSLPKDVSGEVLSFTYEGTQCRVLGLLDASLGELESAARELREAHDLAVARRHAPWIAQTGYELAKVLRASSSSGAARDIDADQLESESLRIARDLGMMGLERALTRTQEAVTTPVVTSPATTTTKIEKTATGSGYVITRGKTTVTMKDSRGMQLLARLIERPNEEIHVLALASDEPNASVPESDAGELLDETAKRAYRKRVVDLDEDIAEAERAAHARRAEKLTREKEALLGELARAVGLGGRSRQASSATERARVNVQRRLKDALAKIAEQDEDLARFFERSVRTGTFCCFRPT